uniref:Secreted protein n=1 Tax=Pararge aegeria TaxID=116150 RepID=S4NWR5_9NEOP
MALLLYFFWIVMYLKKSPANTRYLVPLITIKPWYRGNSFRFCFQFIHKRTPATLIVYISETRLTFCPYVDYLFCYPNVLVSFYLELVKNKNGG